MDAGNGKSSDFRLSQALANQVVRKGVCGDFILCGLSPPVSASWSLVHRYTLLTTDGLYQNPRFHLLSHALKTHCLTLRKLRSDRVPESTDSGLEYRA